MYEEILFKLSKSAFRNRFKLDEKDKLYIKEKGIDKIESHAKDFIRLRISPKFIPNDGKQTPMRGHPVFKAQHATAVCCRKCIYKWHHIPQNMELSDKQQSYLTGLIMEWIKKQIADNK